MPRALLFRAPVSCSTLKLSELNQFVPHIDDLIQHGAKQIAFPVGSGFFSRIDSSPLNRRNHDA